MLTYTPPELRPPKPPREYPWMLLLLAFVWLWPGVFAHDLWKPSEPQLFAVIENHYPASPWLPLLFGQPYFAAPPVYVWLAALLKNMLSPWAIDAYAAARLATTCFTCIGLSSCGIAGFKLLGRHHGRSVVLLLIGSTGLLPVAHFLNTASVLFAGTGLCLWGMAAAQRKTVLAALLAGIGMLLLAQAAGLPAAAAAWLVILLLWRHPLWHSTRHLMFALGTAAVALPLLTVYPLALAAADPAAFQEYLHHHLFGSFGGTAHVQVAFHLPYYLRNLLWFALPAWPLAVWTAADSRFLQQRAGVLALLWLTVFGLLIVLSPQTDQDQLILLLPVIALLGAARLDKLRRGAAAFLNWFGITAFGAAALFLWIGFFAMNYGFPAKLAERAAYFSPYYTPAVNPVPILTALLLTPVWLTAITRKHIRGRQALTNWAAGMTLVWSLLLTLFLPWLDAAKSYRPVVEEMQRTLSAEIHTQLTEGSECLFIHPSAYDARTAWQQYGHLPFTVSDPQCRYELAQYRPNTALPAGGRILWQGRRPRNKIEAFALIGKY